MRKKIKFVLKHQGFRRYFSNTSWLFGEQILRVFSALIIGAYVARYLGPEKFGLFSYVIAYVAIFISFAKLGLDGILVRDLVNNPNNRVIYLGTAFWLKIIGAVISISALSFSLMFADNDKTTNLYIFLVALGVFFQAFEVVDFYFQSRVLSKYVSLCKIFQLILSSILKLYFIYIGANLFWFVLVIVIDQASLALAFYYSYLKQDNRNFYLKFDKSLARELLVSAKPLIFSGIMVSIYSSIDRVIIKEMLGSKDVGIYVAATGLTMALYFIPALISASLFPAIVSAKLNSDLLYTQRLTMLYKTMCLGGLLVCTFVSINASKIIQIIYGEKYIESAVILQIHIWIFLFLCFSAVFGKWLLSENLQNVVPRFTLMALIINVVGCFIFVPLWSIKGAAFVALASQAIPVIFYGLFNKQMRSQIKLVFLK